MFCPECRAEYRPGFARCSDCDVELVAEPPGDEVRAAGPQDLEYVGEDEHSLRVVWQGDDESYCVSLCRELQKAGFHFRVAQAVKSRGIRMDVTWNFQIGVPASDYKRAKEILALEDESSARTEQQLEDDDDEGNSEFALPEGDRAEADAASEEEQERSRTYLKDWYPEDATVTVWQQEESGTDYRDAIEMGLKENLIHFSSATGTNAPNRVCVLPEDEARAREIVREIIDDQPPENASGSRHKGFSTDV